MCYVCYYVKAVKIRLLFIENKAELASQISIILKISWIIAGF